MRKYVAEEKVQARDLSDAFCSTTYVGHRDSPQVACQDTARLALSRLHMDLHELKNTLFGYLPTTLSENRGSYYTNLNMEDDPRVVNSARFIRVCNQMLLARQLELDDVNRCINLFLGVSEPLTHAGIIPNTVLLTGMLVPPSQWSYPKQGGASSLIPTAARTTRISVMMPPCDYDPYPTIEWIFPTGPERFPMNLTMIKTARDFIVPLGYR